MLYLSVRKRETKGIKNILRETHVTIYNYMARLVKAVRLPMAPPYQKKIIYKKVNSRLGGVCAKAHLIYELFPSIKVR